MPAIDSEVWVGGEYYRVGKRFAQAHKAGVGEAHGNVCVFLQELEDWLHVVVQVKRHDQSPAAKQRAEFRPPMSTEKVECFRQDGFAGAPGWSVAGRDSRRPPVVGVAAA
jgi:hypothetical protein